MDETGLDTREFDKACEEVIRHSEKTYPEFINGRLLAVALKAADNTKAANKETIASVLGQVRAEVVTSKTGRSRIKRKFDTSKGSIASRIINARRKRQGLPLIWGDKLADASRKMIAARLRSVNFIRSGWVYAQRILARSVYGSAYRAKKDLAKMTGTAKGGAFPAEFAISSEVTGQIFNSALITMSKGGTTGDPMPVAKEGLQIAMDAEQKEMLDHLAKKLQPIMDEHSAK